MVNFLTEKLQKILPLFKFILKNVQHKYILQIDYELFYLELQKSVNSMK